MRLPDQNKRRKIAEAAVRLFSERPFEQVRLEEVAAAAGVGKGTLYIYFKSKDELYYSLIYDGFADLVKRLEEQLRASQSDYSGKIRVIVSGMVEFAQSHPQMIDVMRAAGVPDANSPWGAKLRELAQLIEKVIRQGIAAGELADTKPELTALYFTAMVRAIMLHGPREADAQAAAQHVSGVILGGIGKHGR
ncbi:MAG: TetR/AcrR family transcriptional regulator [Tepidisphaeraceae bacterium]|jgi:AcrR family transcriptional regulator